MTTLYRFVGDTPEEFSHLGRVDPGDERPGPDGLRHVRLETKVGGRWAPTIPDLSDVGVIVPATDEGLVLPVVIDPPDPDDPVAPYDPSSHTANEVIDYLRSHPEAADAVRIAELDGKSRKTVLEAAGLLVPDPPEAPPDPDNVSTDPEDEVT